MSEIVSDLPQPCLGEHRLKVAVVEVVATQNRPVRRREHNFVGDVRLGAKADV